MKIMRIIPTAINLSVFVQWMHTLNIKTNVSSVMIYDGLYIACDMFDHKTKDKGCSIIAEFT